MNEADIIVSDAIAMFNRRGDPSNKTNQFDSFGADIQKIIGTKMNNGEIPAIASCIDTDHVTVITSDRLIRITNGVSVGWAWEDIKDITMNIQRQLVTGAKSLGQCNQLEVVLRSGATETVLVEPGLPMGGFWNAALCVLRRKTSG